MEKSRYTCLDVNHAVEPLAVVRSPLKGETREESVCGEGEGGICGLGEVQCSEHQLIKPKR